MIGLIVKGASAIFLAGSDPGSELAIAFVNRYRMGNSRSLETKLSASNLQQVARPRPLSREGLAWAYVFVTLTDGDERRLEPGPFDDELAGVVGAIEEQSRGVPGETT